MADNTDSTTVRFEPNGGLIKVSFGSGGLIGRWSLIAFKDSQHLWARHGESHDPEPDFVDGIRPNTIDSTTVLAWYYDLYPPPVDLEGKILVRVHQGDQEVGRMTVDVKLTKGQPNSVHGLIKFVTA